MNLSELLNSDVRSIGQLARQGFGWWTAELAAMTPQALRRRDRRAGGVIATPLGDGAGYLLTRDGLQLETVRTPSRSRRVQLALAPAEVLAREAVLPLLSPRDTVRLLANELDRLTPFGPAAACFDYEVLERDVERGRQRLLLGVLPRAAAEAHLARASAMGLQPQALGVADGSHIRFDFLPQVGGAESGVASRRRRLWWITVGGLMLLNLLLLVIRDTTDVSRLRDTVAAQRATAALASRAREKVAAESAARSDLIARQARQEPLRLLAAVTAALPAGARVERFEWNGRTVRITGYAPPGVEPTTALRASVMFVNVRSLGTDAPALGATNQPFDVSADLRGATP